MDLISPRNQTLKHCVHSLPWLLHYFLSHNAQFSYIGGLMYILGSLCNYLGDLLRSLPPSVVCLCCGVFCAQTVQDSPVVFIQVEYRIVLLIFLLLQFSIT